MSGRYRGPVNEHPLFEKKPEWSHWKHRLLHCYLGRFAGIVGSKHPEVFYVDGFAGAGRYRSSAAHSNEHADEGSPVIAAKIATDCLKEQRRYRLHCINVELHSYDRLVEATASFDPSLVENRKGRFNEHLDEILSAVGSSPALFFLDPFGHKGMAWNTVAKIAERRRAQGAITEVLLNFYISKINRDAGKLGSPDKSNRSFVRLLDDLFGTDEWQAIWNESAVGERAGNLAELYRRRLAEAFRGIAVWHPVRTIGGALKYLLVFGTSSRRGCRAMSEAVYIVSSEYAQKHLLYTVKPPSPQMELFEEPATENGDTAIIRELTPAILELLPSRATITFGQLQDDLSLSFFGRAIAKHYRTALRQLINDNMATLISNKKAINDATLVRLV